MKELMFDFLFACTFMVGIVVGGVLVLLLTADRGINERE